MTHDSPLPTFHVPHGLSIAQAELPAAPPVTLDSPAHDVVTDLTRVKAATTSPAVLLAQAEQTMILHGVRLLFVVSDMPSVEGLITTTDLHGDRAMRIVHERGLRHDELCVADVMTPLAMLEAVDFDSLRSASVANVISTLKQFGRQHLLVVQGTDARAKRIRGLISQSQLERQLGRPINLTEIASSFAEIGHALGH